jgi:hypothetical protein
MKACNQFYLPVLAGLLDTKHNEDLCDYALQGASEEEGMTAQDNICNAHQE